MGKAKPTAQPSETLRGLDKVRVPKKALLESIKANRDTHRAQFEVGIEAYRKAVIHELEEQVARAKAGKNIVRFSALTQPEDHTPEYDAVISMLEMSLDTEFLLPYAHYRQYVLDEWSWMDQFSDSVSSNVDYLRSAGL